MHPIVEVERKISVTEEEKQKKRKRMGGGEGNLLQDYNVQSPSSLQKKLQIWNAHFPVRTPQVMFRELI